MSESGAKIRTRMYSATQLLVDIRSCSSLDELSELERRVNHDCDEWRSFMRMALKRALNDALDRLCVADQNA